MPIATTTVSSIGFLKLSSYICMTSIFAYLGIKEEAFYILTILIFFDVLTGILKNVRLGNHRVRSSIGVAGFITKVIIIFIPVTLAFLLKGLGMHSTGFLAGSFSILSLYETYSILGNIYTIRTGKENNSEYDAVSELIKLLQNWINHYTILIMDKLKINSNKNDGK